MKKLTLITLILLVVALLALPLFAACTTPAEQEEEEEEPIEGPQYGGVLKVLANPSIANLGLPWDVSMGDWPRPCIETLTTIGKEGVPIPWLATDWEISPDYTSITFTLREGVKFHDGTPFNAEAVKFNWDKTREAGKAELKTVTSIDVIDDYTLQVNFSTMPPTFLADITFSAGMIISPTAFETMGEECLLHPVGTGPFKFVSYERDTLVTFERFDEYWQPDQPYLDGFEWVLVADPVTRLLAFEAEEGNIIVDLTPKDAIDLANTGANIVSHPFLLVGFAGDSEHPDSPFADVRVRQALAYAIDAEAIAQVAGYGTFIATNQPAAPNSWAYNPDVEDYPYNPEKARELLDEAGIPEGYKMKITYEIMSGTDLAFVMVQNYLSNVGIDLELDVADRARMKELQFNGWSNQLVFWIVPSSVGYDPGSALRNYLSTTPTRYPDIWIPEDYQELLDQVNAEPNHEARVALMMEIMELAVDEYCLAIPMYAATSIGAIAPEVQDCDLYAYSRSHWKTGPIWLSP